MIDLLKTELKARTESIALFRLNIDKFTRMLGKIDAASPESLRSYADELEARIASEQAALDREELIYEATQEILAEMEAG